VAFPVGFPLISIGEWCIEVSDVEVVFGLERKDEGKSRELKRLEETHRKFLNGSSDNSYLFNLVGSILENVQVEMNNHAFEHHLYFRC
jgi:hypothetical protein